MNTVPFDYEQIKIRSIYRSEDLETFREIPVPSPIVEQVYGEPLRFPQAPEERPYLYASFVMSVDGRMAYADQPSAFYVAAKNERGGAGRDTDFWLLNALRAVGDASLIGGNSLKTDPDYAMYCLDAGMQRDRLWARYPRYPLNLVMSLDARDIPLDHALLRSREIPVVLVTSPQGLEYVRAHFAGEISSADASQPEEELKLWLPKGGETQLHVLVSGENSMPDTPLVLRALRGLGIRRLLVESPGYAHYLVTQGLMDEFFLNQSGVYIGGGDTMTIGKAGKGFSSELHPHMQLLQEHVYNEYFQYFRYRFHYPSSLN